MVVLNKAVRETNVTPATFAHGSPVSLSRGSLFGFYVIFTGIKIGDFSVMGIYINPFGLLEEGKKSKSDVSYPWLVF